MSIHPYNLRSRVNSPAAVKTPTPTPSSKTLLHHSKKSHHSPVSIQLDHVVGATTKDPCGLSACPLNSTFAYCAGSVAVLAYVDHLGNISRRYYRARPAAIPLNPSISYYSTPTSTPTAKRSGLSTPRRDTDVDTLNRGPLEDDNVKTWTARERIKSIKCVSLSSNGKLLAVGESGYNPRVLLYSTSKDAATETPLSTVTDHTWGVRSVAFSPNSCYLATLGEANDGFLFIWTVNPKTGSLKLCATNKCTTNICHMTWCGQYLITAGVRHVKIWQIPDPDKLSPTKRSRLRNGFEPLSTAAPIPLPGRNCLLGDLVDETFTCIVAISNHQVLVCTDSGVLCTVDVSKSPAELIPVGHELHPTSAMGLRETPSRLVWTGGGKEMRDISLDALLSPTEAHDRQSRLSDSCTDAAAFRAPKRSPLRQSLGLSQHNPNSIVALACLTNHTVCVDSQSNLTISATGAAANSLPPSSDLLLSHNLPVQGVQAFDAVTDLGSFFTWSKDGEVRFWEDDGHLRRVEHIQLEEGLDGDDVVGNELKLLRYFGHGSFISGDRYGVLKVVQSDAWQILQTIRAHSAEVNDICIDSTSTFIATAGRDRNVQIFKLQHSTIELLQTTDDHIASVNQIVFNPDGGILLSCSADRTIVVREKASRELGNEVLVAFLSVRIITIKASPLSMCLASGAEESLFVSTLDRHITKIDFISGMVIDTFKVTDPELDDNAVLNSIQSFTNTDSNGVHRLLVGVSTIDKSVRLYNSDRRALLWRESAHTEGISDVALIQSPTGLYESKSQRFVSTGLDSTIMMWTVAQNQHMSVTPTIELTYDQVMSTGDLDSTPAKPSPAVLPPLRKVLTKVDIAEFARSHSPRTPTRETSPVRLKRKGSRLALATSVAEDTDRTSSPAPKRRASCDEHENTKRRSPSPPPYATKRHKLPSSRREIPKDLFTKPNDQQQQSPSPQISTDGSSAGSKPENKANKARLRRPPSVPTDLRARAFEQRRPSTVPSLSELASMNLATEHVCQVLQKYRKRLGGATTDVDLSSIEVELKLTLKDIERTITTKSGNPTDLQQRTTTTRSRPVRQNTVDNCLLGQTKRNNNSNNGITAENQPESISSARRKGVEHNGSLEKLNLGVDGLSVLLEKTNLGTSSST